MNGIHRWSVSNHQPHDCLLNRLFRRKSKKTSKLRVTGLCGVIHRWLVNSLHKEPVTRKMFPVDDVILSRHTTNGATTPTAVNLSSVDSGNTFFFKWLEEICQKCNQSPYMVYRYSAMSKPYHIHRDVLRGWASSRFCRTIFHRVSCCAFVVMLLYSTVAMMTSSNGNIFRVTDP